MTETLGNVCAQIEV